MVKHVILWQLKDELSDAEKAAVKAGIKEGLDGQMCIRDRAWRACQHQRSPLFHRRPDAGHHL